MESDAANNVRGTPPLRSGVALTTGPGSRDKRSRASAASEHGYRRTDGVRWATCSAGGQIHGGWSGLFVFGTSAPIASSLGSPHCGCYRYPVQQRASPDVTQGGDSVGDAGLDGPVPVSVPVPGCVPGHTRRWTRALAIVVQRLDLNFQ